VRLARALFIASTIAFLALVAFAWRRRIDPRVHEAYASDLAYLRAANSFLNETALRQRIDAGGNYDGVTATLRELRQVHADLRNVPAFLSTPARARVAAAVEKSATSMANRERTVERFKSENAAFEASLRILGEDTANLQAPNGDERQRRLADRASALRVELLQLVVMRAEGHKAAVDSALEGLKTEAATWPEADQTNAKRLIERVRRMMERVLRLKTLVEAVVEAFAEKGTSAADRERALTAVYVDAVDSARATWNLSIAGLFGLALAMITSAAAYVISRLRRSATELGRASDKLTTALVQLQEERAKEKELADLKTRFVAMTSHEFRTPLSVISSSAELLQSYGEKWTQEKRGEHLTRIRTSVKGMTTMLDRILLIGRTEAGMLEYRPAPCALDELCRDIAETMELADQGKHTLDVVVTPEVGTAEADAKLVRHVLENLLSNALKYSPEGSTVRFEVARDGDFVVMVITDRGIGIPEEDRARLFDGFHRAKNALHIAGTGLGLAVVKRAVALHGGTLELDSKVGEGTTFTVRVKATKEGQR
jgi:signal transduction histidine kinase